MLQRSPTSHRGGSIPNFYRIETFVTIATASKDSSSCESGSAIAANSFWRATPPASPKSEVHLFKRQSACTKFRNFLFLLCWNLLTPTSASLRLQKQAEDRDVPSSTRSTFTSQPIISSTLDTSCSRNGTVHKLPETLISYRRS